jgi:DNA polymerase-3 subunit beta
VILEALATAGRAAAARGLQPAHAGVRAAVEGDRLRLTGSDTDHTIEIETPVAGADDGVAVVPARLTADWIRALEPGSVTIDADGDEAHLSSGRSQCTVRVVPADDFVSLTPAAGEPVSITASAFADALRQVVPAAGREDTRPILTGVLMAAEASGVRLVATDSYRLAVRDLPGATVLAEGQKVLVPSRALAELARLLGTADEVRLHLGEFEATFDVGSARLTTRLIEGEFPNYRQLIPSGYPNRLTVGKEQLLDAVRRVKLLARESAPVRLELRSGGLDLTAATQDVGQAREELDAKYEGAELVVAFNPDYLIAGVEAAGGDEVVLETLDALKPAIVRSSESPDFLYLLMPVRVT